MHFARVLREAGIPVGPGAVIDALDAAHVRIAPDARGFLLDAACRLREAARPARGLRPGLPRLLEEAEDAGAADAAVLPSDRPRRRREGQAGGLPAPGGSHVRQARGARASSARRRTTWKSTRRFTASADEVLRRKDFEQMTVAEQAQARQAIARLRLHRTEIMTRRLQPALKGSVIDMRRTLKGSLRAGGHFIDLERRAQAMARAAAGRALRHLRIMFELQPHVPALPACACRMTATG